MPGFHRMFAAVLWEECWMDVRRYYAVSYPFFEMEAHSHPELEIMYAVHGKCQVSYWEEGETRTFFLREGEYCVIAGGVPHRLTVRRGLPCRVLNLEIARITAEPSFSLAMLAADDAVRQFCLSEEYAYRGTDDGALHASIVSLQRELGTGSENALGVAFQLGSLFLTLARPHGRRPRAGGGVYVRRALAFLEENFDGELSVADVAAAAGISGSYLQRLFQDALGCTLVEKISALRIEKAKLLLETSSLPVLDVAVSVGYNNRQHFTYMFSRQVGCSPAEYRRNGGNTQVREERLL